MGQVSDDHMTGGISIQLFQLYQRLGLTHKAHNHNKSIGTMIPISIIGKLQIDIFRVNLGWVHKKTFFLLLEMGLYIYILYIYLHITIYNYIYHHIS